MSSLSELLQKHGAEEGRTELTFSEYFDLVLAEPSIAKLSHARVYDMLTEKGPNGTEFFDGTIFGAEEAIGQLASIFKSASKRMEIRKRIFLLMGPVGAGKSSAVDALKRGLEAYTKRSPVYAIADCPLQEEPLHLLPEGARPELAEKGVYVEGGLCPYCERTYAGKDISEVKIRRFPLSESKRLGIGTFAASDSKNQSVDDLVGTVNLAMIAEYGEDDPRAWSYSGEIQRANRGLLECVELFKAHQELLWTFLDVTQEGVVKVTRQAMCPVDEVIIAHSNQAEFDKFIADAKNEALRDRIVPIKWGYTLSIDAEQKIYRRLLSQRALDGVHVPGASLKVAAQFAVLTRLTESDKLKSSDDKSGLVKKMRLYNGEKQAGFTEIDVKQLHMESPTEGMDGAGPRQIINALSLTLVDGDKACLTPISTVRGLKDLIDHNIQLSDQKKRMMLDRLSIARELFVQDAKIEVQKGFVHGFSDAARDMFNKYIDHVGAFLNDEKIEDPLTPGKMIEPNLRLMRRVEEMVGIPENSAKQFRAEVFFKMAEAQRKGREFNYASHPQLREGIEKALFSDLKDAINLTTRKSHDKDSQRKFNEVVSAMTELGYCEHCAGDLIEFVAEQLS